IFENILTAGVQQPIQIIVMIGILFYLHWQMTLGVMVIAPVIGGTLYHFARTLRRNTRKEKKRSDRLSSSMTEGLANVRLVKALGTEGMEVRKFNRQSMEVFHYIMKRRIAKFGSRPIMEWLGTLAAGGVALAGGYMI